MGGSQPVESDKELFVPVIEQRKHNKSTIRVPHKFYFCFSTNVKKWTLSVANIFVATLEQHASQDEAPKAANKCSSSQAEK